MAAPPSGRDRDAELKSSRLDLSQVSESRSRNPRNGLPFVLSARDKNERHRGIQMHPAPRCFFAENLRERTNHLQTRQANLWNRALLERERKIVFILERSQHSGKVCDVMVTEGLGWKKRKTLDSVQVARFSGIRENRVNIVPLAVIFVNYDLSWILVRLYRKYRCPHRLILLQSG